MTDQDHFKNICNLTTSILGLRKGSLSYKSRKREIQFGRMIASVIGRKEEGIKREIIAEQLNRHRTLIYHYENSHEGNFMFPEYRDAYSKVYLAYHKLDRSRNIFTDPHIMKEFLLRKGVKEHPKAEVTIIVKSGEVGCGIKTSLLDFSNQLENIKLVLNKENYKYKIVDFKVNK
jgi:hypothetical protein